MRQDCLPAQCVGVAATSRHPTSTKPSVFSGRAGASDHKDQSGATFVQPARSVLQRTAWLARFLGVFLLNPASASGVQLLNQPLPSVVHYEVIDRPLFYDSVAGFGSTLLPLGLDLSAVGLVSSNDEEFPSGRQFAYVYLHTPTMWGADRSRLLEGIDVSRLRNLEGPDAGDWLNIILIKSHGIFSAQGPQNPLNMNFQFSVEELLSQRDFEEVLGGLWNLWVDEEDILTRLSIRYVPNQTDPVVVSPRWQQFVCIEDGIVVGSFDDYWIRTSDAHLQWIVDECLAGRIGLDWSPASFPVLGGSSEFAPQFRLSDGAGNVVGNEELLGRPFVLLVAAPKGESAVTGPRTDPPRPALDPGPRVRLAQVQELLRDSGLVDIPILIVALPYGRDDPYDRDELPIQGAEVAELLRKQLDVPVYEDASGNFLGAYSQLLQAPATAIVLVDGSGRLVGRFSDSYADLDFRLSPSLAVELLRLASESTP